jgi:hypothetical protein
LVAKARPLHIGDESVQALVVEAQAVDQGIGFRQAEHAGFGVAGLRLGRDGAHLDKTEAHRGQAIDAAGVLVEPGGQSHPVRELQAGQRVGVVHARLAVEAGQRRMLQAGDRAQGEFVGGLGVHAEQERACDSVREKRHWIIRLVVFTDCLK